MKQKNTVIICSVFFIGLLLSGCSSIRPLARSPYRYDIIIQADNSIMIENDLIDFRMFREELTKRMVGNKDRILLHVHIDVSEKVFDAVLSKLHEYNYKDIEPRLYK